MSNAPVEDRPDTGAEDAQGGNRRSIPTVPSPVIIGGAVLAAVIVGRFAADGRGKYGLAIVIAAWFGALVFFNLAAGLAVWVAIIFFSQLRFLSSGPNAVGLLVFLGWIGAVLGRKGQVGILRHHRQLLMTVLLFGLWLTMSIAWAERPGPAATEVGYWWLAISVFVVAMTSLTSPREVSWIAVAFVVGSVLSVVIGIATGALNSVSATAAGQTAIQGRLTGGGGDPNAQAAGFVAAMFLTTGLFSVFRGRTARLWLLGAFALITVGFFATQSRGGLVALAAGALAAVIVSPRQRRRILSLIPLVAAAAASFVAWQPGALSRITDFGGGSSGRDDLWSVAWHVFTSHPLFGVGAANFQTIEARFTLRPGAISRVQYIAEVPHLVHNVYLQLLAETGLIGLLAFIAVIIGSLRAGHMAAKAFEARKQVAYADLTRAVMMGTVGMLSACLFISDGNDFRLWILLALGPLLLTLSSRIGTEPKPSGPPPLPMRARLLDVNQPAISLADGPRRTR